MRSQCPPFIAKDTPEIECEFYTDGKLAWVHGITRYLTDNEFHLLTRVYHETLERQAQEEADRQFENALQEEAGEYKK